MKANNNLYKALEVTYKQCKENDWDAWWIVAGDEGRGKTHLDLHIIEWWCNKLNGKTTEEDIKHISLDREKWKEQLSKIKKHEISVFDEAGELNNRRFMGKFNVEITQFARIIRGNNNFVILTIQDFFDIDPFFAKRRVKGLIYINKRGHYYFWSHKKIKILVAMNKLLYVKNYFRVKPTFEGTYPIYDGVLAESYKGLKESFIKEQQANLIKSEDQKEIEANDEKELFFKIMRMKKEGLSDIAIGRIEGVCRETINKFRNKYVNEI